ncbi:protein SCAR2 isoform X2 [Gastrolobium bilobum]|uniref:protein SCAR2 isoform X2 n=1 Tax=Gastrolobium bilobum TaxID=150636 RepID=UPI002AAF8371|nr:protein SCAR2 isoform X2 [Gastrolobium bilobum]
MPISKYHIRNEYSLADPELYRAADKDDPEALLEAVAMAGLVGLLRQLGDLAEFATEIFHNLHEEVMATSARGQSLMARVQQLEAEVPSLEKAFFSQTHHSSFFTNGGMDWHPNLRSEQNLVTQGDLPRFIMDSYEECRGPPRLFLLDKFDVAGAGACLKRYTDPSFFKLESASPVKATIGVHREKRIRKVKKKGSRLRDSEAPNVVPTHAKLHQLLLEERIENGYSNPARLVKLKKRQLNGPAVEAKAGKSYMGKFLETPSPDHKMICETSICPLPATLTSDDTSEEGLKILEISSISPVKKSLGNENTCSSPNEQELELKPFSKVDGETNGDLVKVKEQIPDGVADEMSFNHIRLPDETELAIDEQKKIECSLDHSDDVTSEVDNFMDALTTMESELETDNEYKPKISFLNIQKVSDTDDKEEHQLQFRFSYSPSFGDSSISDDISSLKQDRNEEHIEVQARLSDALSTGTASTSDNHSSFRRDGDECIELQGHFSDSQSIGNSSTSDKNSSLKKDRSDFPHSDSLSTAVENMPSEPILVTNTKYYDQEVEVRASNHLPQIVEFENTDCGKFVMHDDAHIHEKENSDSGQTSSDLMTSRQVLCSDIGPTSPVTLSAGTQSDETPSGTVELNLRLDDDEDRTGLVEPITAKPDSLSLIKDGACPVDSSEKTSLDNLDVDDPYVHLQVSNDLEVAHEDECSDHSEIKMFHEESPSENCSGILVCKDIGSRGEDPVGSSVEELGLNSGTAVVLDCRDSKDEDCTIATQLNLEDLSPVVKVPPLSCFAGELSSGGTHNNPRDEPGSAEIEVLHCDLQTNFEVIPKTVYDDEINGSISSVDPVEGDGQFKHPSFPDIHVMANDVDTENDQSEDKAVYSVPSAESAKNDAGINTCPASGLICSLSRSLSSLQEPLSGSSHSYVMEMESNEVELTQISLDSNAEKREDQLASSLDITSSDIMYSPKGNLTKLEESLSTFSDPQDKVHGPVARESLTELEERKIVDQPEIAWADVQPNLKKSVPCDLPDSEICNNIQNSSSREKFQHNVLAEDVKMVPELSGLDSQQSESCDQNDLLQSGRDSFSSPSYKQLESENDFEQLVQSQVGERDAECLLRDEQNFASEKSQLEEKSPHATTESASEIHAEEGSSSCSLPQSFGWGSNPTKHVMDPVKPLVPDHFPKATQANLDEMPPMPPLPPMQWRMGRVQHTSLASQREELEVSQASVQPTQPTKPHTESQFVLPTSERETLLYQSQFLPVMAVESDKLQQSSGFSVGVSGHPVAIPLQFPIMVNEAKGQYNHLMLDRNQIQNPFLTLPSTGRPPHGYIVTSEADMVQNSNLHPTVLPAECAISMLDSISSQEKLIQPPIQLMTDTSSEVKILQQSLSNVVSTGMPPHDVASEGEMVQNSNLCATIPPAECSVSGHDSITQEKLTQPPSQLMVETSSEVKTLQHSKSNVVSTGRSPHGVASEEEMVHNSKLCAAIPPAEHAVSGLDSISPQEKPTQPPSSSKTETSSNDTLQQSISNVVSTDRPSQGHIASEGEMVPNSNPCPPTPTTECAVSGHDSISSQEKLTQPPSQLMTETSLEVKIVHQSVSNVEGEQGCLSVSLMSPSSVESREPNQSFVPFEGEMTSSLDTYAQTSNYDSERTNGKPKNKLPRPRSPLIDAVAAHDKSTLRRVTERVMPEIAPKVDERDSLLEQIRTKSFNLKPAVDTRPSIQGPTNLKFAAILEKANAIRQVLAGSDDDDDDADSWSDS